VLLDVTAVAGSYEGRLDAAKNEITGTWRENGQASHPEELVVVAAVHRNAPSSEAYWKLNVPGGEKYLKELGLKPPSRLAQ